jgi:hypothetical protein
VKIYLRALSAPNFHFQGSVVEHEEFFNSIGRFSPFTSVPGIESVLATNGRLPLIPGLLASAYIISHLKAGDDPTQSFRKLA